MITAALLANPASGTDIRRLVAHGSVFDNQEKVRMVRRIILGLEKAGVERILYMPDGYGIVERALNAISPSVKMDALEMTIRNTQQDTMDAASVMETLGASCLVTLGGDGTSRAACKGTLGVPMLSLSTGTNNVFPVMTEATIAGLAAGIVATGRYPLEQTCRRACILDVFVDGEHTDIALVDAAVYSEVFVASRAVWDMDKVSHLFMTRCRPDAIGLSAIGGQLRTITPDEPIGLALELDREAHKYVTAPIAPGMFADVGIQSISEMQPGETFTVDASPCIIALDGEREVGIRRGSIVDISLRTDGPWVVDMQKVMDLAQRDGLFRHDTTTGES